MLPQPNFGHASEPSKGGDEEDFDGPPRKLGRLRIAMWAQAVFAVLASNFLIVSVFAYRSMSTDELADLFSETEDADEVAELARQAADYYGGTSFLTSNLVIGGITILAAIVAALCAMRFKTRMKVVRRVSIAATTVLFLAGMLMTTVFGYFVAPWVVASVLALWWLFSSDVKYWLSESKVKVV